MSKLKMTGAAALLAIAPLMMITTADARPRGVGGGGMAFHGGGGGMAFHGGGGGMAFRGSGATVGGATVGAASVGGVRNPGASFAAVGGPGFAGRGGTAVASPTVHSWNGGRWGHRHWDGRRWIGPGVGFAAGLATGAALGGTYYDDYGYYGDGYYADADYGYVGDSYAYDVGPDVTYTAVSGGDSVSYCQRTFRSYDPASGTYLGYDGLRHPCP